MLVAFDLCRGNVHQKNKFPNMKLRDKVRLEVGSAYKVVISVNHGCGGMFDGKQK